MTKGSAKKSSNSTTLAKSNKNVPKKPAVRPIESVESILHDVMGKDVEIFPEDDVMKSGLAATAIAESPAKPTEGEEEELILEIYANTQQHYERIARWVCDFGLRMTTPIKDWPRHAVGHRHPHFIGPPGKMELLLQHSWYMHYVFDTTCVQRPDVRAIYIALKGRMPEGGACSCYKCNIIRKETGQAPLYNADGKQDDPHT